MNNNTYSMIYGTKGNDKNILISPSLLMRLFEWCHEDATDDVSMHNVFERIIAFNDGINPLSMDSYHVIISNANDDSKDNSEDNSTNQETNDNMNLNKCITDICYDSKLNIPYILDSSIITNESRIDNFEKYGAYTDEDTGEVFCKCSWCNEEYPIEELKIEKDLGPLCRQCIRGIESREKGLIFPEDLNESRENKHLKNINKEIMDILRLSKL